MTGDRQGPAHLAVPWVAAAPAAALVEWGVFIPSVFSIPIPPYHAGTWDAGTLLGLGILGVLASAVGRGAAGLAGVVIGAGSADVVLLFILARQAPVNLGVFSSVPAAAWPGLVSGALMLGLLAICAGYLAGRTLQALAQWPGSGRPIRRIDLGDLALLLAALLATAAVAGASVIAVGGSAYVAGAGMPASSAGSDGGTVAAAAALLGVLVAGGSAGGSGIAVRRRRRGGTPGTDEGWIALGAGLPAALLLGGWALFVIDLAANPF